MSPYDAYEQARKHYEGYTAGTPGYISTKIATYALRLLGLGYDEIDNLLITYYRSGKTRDRVVAAYEHHLNRTMNKTKERQAMKYAACSTCKNEPYQAGVGGPCATCAVTEISIIPSNFKSVLSPWTAVEQGPAPIKRALATQVGGAHYKDMPIQPVEFITKNGLGFLEGCVIKRVCRWKAKDGVQDLRKAIHEIELLIEMEAKP